jgi:hypothetical protein
MSIPLDRPGRELLSGMRCDTALRLGPKEIAIIHPEDP